MSERNYDVEATAARSSANADTVVAAAIIQAKAIDRLTYEVARFATAIEKFLTVIEQRK